MNELMLHLRFFNREEVIEKYRIRPDIEEEFFQECPVSWFSDGEPVFKESDVDEYFRHFRVPPYIHPSRRRGGKKSSSLEIALFAASLHLDGKSWKEITKEVNEKFPPLPGQKKRTAESLRKLVERHYGKEMRTDGCVRVASAAQGNDDGQAACDTAETKKSAAVNKRSNTALSPYQATSPDTNNKGDDYGYK